MTKWIVEKRELFSLGAYEFPSMVVAKLEEEDGVFCWQVDEFGINLVACFTEYKTFEEAEPALEEELASSLSFFQHGTKDTWDEKSWSTVKFARDIKQRESGTK